MSTIKSSKSSKKDVAPQFDADPEMKQRAKKALASRSKKQQSFFDKYAYHFVFGIIAVVMIGSLIHSFWKSGPNIQTTDVNDEQYIAEKNGGGNTFQVGKVNFFEGYKLIDVKNVLNAQVSNKKQLYYCNPGTQDVIIPESYNFKNEYPACTRNILNQGNCSSSYSIASVSAINDRLCKGNDNHQYPVLSPQGPLACDKAINRGCKGGFISRALDFAKFYGLVDEKCLPYNETLSTPQQCQKITSSCEKFKIADYCVPKDAEAVKQEIIKNGPIISVIPVYRDFLIYKKGLYQVYPRNQRYSTGLALKVIGWDLRNGQSCWLVENSWGQDWGEDGLACILVNQDQLRLESMVLAPVLSAENNEDGEQTSEVSEEKTQTEQIELDAEEVQQSEL